MRKTKRYLESRAAVENLVRERYLITTAYHEAGHAVIGRAMGQLCGSVTIEPDNDSGGHSVTADVYDTCAVWETLGRWRDPMSILVGRVITVMAGAESEAEILDTSAIGDKTDRQQIDLMLKHFLTADSPPETFQFFEAKLRRWTRYFVCRHRDRIKQVADALLARHTLDSFEVDEILGWSSIRNV